MLTEELKKKIEFVKKLNEAMQVAGKSVEQVNYKIFESDSVIREYLEVVYKGGARAVRNCAGDSCYAVLEELGKLVYGGYYAEVADIERYECSPEYKLISSPSAEPEIIYCGECKYMMPDGRCSVFADPSIRPSASDYCSNAERRQDVEDSKEMTSAEQERKKGKWIDNKGLYQCSVCKHLWSELWWTETCPIDRMNKMMHYCPNCGAKMEQTTNAQTVAI